MGHIFEFQYSREVNARNAPEDTTDVNETLANKDDIEPSVLDSFHEKCAQSTSSTLEQTTKSELILSMNKAQENAEQKKEEQVW